MKNEIVNINDLKGKTIANLILDCGDLWIKFTDNTFVVLVVNDITEGFGSAQNEVNIYKYGKDNTDYPLVDLGIISKQEYKEACAQRDMEYQNEQNHRELIRDEETRARELQQLESLKKKYNQ